MLFPSISIFLFIVISLNLLEEHYNGDLLTS